MAKENKIVFDAGNAEVTRYSHQFSDNDWLGFSDRELYEFDGGCFVRAWNECEEIFLIGTSEMAEMYKNHGMSLNDFIASGLKHFSCPKMKCHYILAMCGHDSMCQTVMVPENLTQEESDAQIIQGVKIHFGKELDSIVEFKGGKNSLHEWAEMDRKGASDECLNKYIRWIVHS